MARSIVLRCAARLVLLSLFCWLAPAVYGLDPAETSVDEAFTTGLQLEQKRHWRE
jgi:hypothetical protein